jgi:hypothetical protein
LVNQTARSIRPDFSNTGGAAQSRHVHPGTHIPVAKELRKPPSAPPKMPLRTRQISYRLEGCLSPPDNETGSLKLLSNGNVRFETTGNFSMEFPVSFIRKWLKGKVKGDYAGCKAKLEYGGSCIYPNIGDAAKFLQSCG